MSEACQILHDRLRDLPRRNWKAPIENLPLNGIYVVFEKGEKAHGGDRIVRVGTHTGEGNLKSRLCEHAFVPFRSILRKHIGRCLLAAENSPHLAAWNLPITRADDRVKNLAMRRHPRLQQLDHEITAFVAKKMSFVAFEVKGDRTRTEVESAMLSTVAQCDECGPSRSWLGRHFPAARYKKFPDIGLWNVNGLRKKSMTATQARRLPLGRKSYGDS